MYFRPGPVTVPVAGHLRFLVRPNPIISDRACDSTAGQGGGKNQGPDVLVRCSQSPATRPTYRYCCTAVLYWYTIYDPWDRYYRYPMGSMGDSLPVSTGGGFISVYATGHAGSERTPSRSTYYARLHQQPTALRGYTGIGR